ncbi:MAG: hypothetical protein DRH32_02630 [Deltaproteobacteria bacterium]|nr:MAG: hypothetical protein DRH32_02630 [Deltaproteobacteria bacterium]
MNRNILKGVEGNRVNAILNAAGMNFSKLARYAADLLRLIFGRPCVLAREQKCPLPLFVTGVFSID